MYIGSTQVRLIKWVVEEALQMEKKSNWQKDLEKSLVELGWGGVKQGAERESLLMTEIGMMVGDSVWREVKWKWEVEAQKRLKLGVLQRLLVHGK